MERRKSIQNLVERPIRLISQNGENASVMKILWQTCHFRNPSNADSNSAMLAFGANDIADLSVSFLGGSDDQRAVLFGYTAENSVFDCIAQFEDIGDLFSIIAFDKA
jgi:hypothetical protein